MPDLIKLGWMLIKEHRESQLLNTVFKAYRGTIMLNLLFLGENCVKI